MFRASSWGAVLAACLLSTYPAFAEDPALGVPRNPIRQAVAFPAFQPDNPYSLPLPIGDPKIGETKIGDGKIGDAKTGDAKTGDGKTSDAKTGDVKFGDAKALDAKISDAKVGDGKTDDSKKSEADSLKSLLGFNIDFKNGVGFNSTDNFFSLRINSLLQIDYRDFSHTADGVHNNNALHDNFAMPRIRLFFRGNVSEFVNYAVSVNTGLSPNAANNVPAPVNLLDAYLDISPFGKDCAEYFQFRVGRFKTPYLYQFYKIGPQDFVTPELSVYSTNFLQNWQNGAMAHGALLDKRFEYAAGIFNGVPNSFEVPQDDRQGIFFGAVSPFLLEEDSCLKNLVIAGSYAVGRQRGNALPNVLGTAVASNGPPDSLMVSPTFMVFNPSAIQNGFHDAWALDVIWCYQSLNFYGEYNGGTETYALSATPSKTIPVALNGWSAAVTYFFTGEEITPTRARVKPLQPYNWSAHQWGAFEGFARYSNLVMGSNILDSKLLVAGANANQVDATDIGVHWYWNEYVKITFDWQHSMFNQPVSLAPGTAKAPTTSTEDLLWLRCQLYY